ncbi:MAG: HYR domain-containing protein [Clostridia bacterium]|nr:HYR domain-containing protein [Clostridia bacterium]
MSKKKKKGQKPAAFRENYFNNSEEINKEAVPEAENGASEAAEAALDAETLPDAVSEATEASAADTAAEEVIPSSDIESSDADIPQEEPTQTSEDDVVASDAQSDGAGSEEANEENADGPYDTSDGDETTDCHSSENVESGEIKKRPKSKIVKKVLAIAGISLASLLAVAVVAGFIIVNKIAKPVTGEIGEAIDLSCFEEGFAGKVCEVDPENDLSTEKIDERELSLTFFGFIRKKVPLSIKDTIPPAIELRAVTTMTGMNIDANDFVIRSEDRTEVTFSFEGGSPDVSKEGEYKVTVAAEDEGGNRTLESTVLTVDDLALAVKVEFGKTGEEIEKIVAKEHPEFVTSDLSSVVSSECGEYKATAFDEEETYYLFKIIIKDTTAPTATAHSFDILAGSDFSKDSLVTDIDDRSPTETVFGAEVDPMTPGTYTIPITIKDAYGNKTELESTVVVHKIKDNASFERGVSNKEIISTILEGDSGLSLPDDFSALAVPLGTSELTLYGAFNTISTRVTVTDTVKPELTVQEVTRYTYQNIAPADFVWYCSDFSPLTYSFENTVSTESAGDFTVNIKATDEAGNSVSKSTTLHVLADTTPPTIYGVQNYTVILGQGIPNLSDGVYAVDDLDGNVAVYVDSSEVNASAGGTYTVKYGATDRSGNYASATATVYVTDNQWDILNYLADQVLAQIVSPGMSGRAKAWAIYCWCTSNIRYSTSTSYLMGNYLEGALSGFRTHAGNCFIYYAVSDVLLNRAGVPSMQVHRNIPDRPHYWNLVMVDGCWYHFDTCPHYKAYPIQSFLLTDAEVANYSASCVDYYSFDTWAYPRTP